MTSDLISIDGSQGEGGGQILRTSLALSAITGRPTRLYNIRAGRKKPGILRQHLTAIQAAARVSAAKVQGDELGGSEILFEPGAVQNGEFHFSVGSAGSAMLVFQTVLPILSQAGGPSKVRLQGGTHNPMAPPYDFLTESFVPLLNKLGLSIECRLEQAGFFPAGGGVAEFKVTPASDKRRFCLNEPGELIGGEGRILISKLEGGIAEREARVIRKQLGWSSEIVRVPSPGPGNAVLLVARRKNITNLFTAFGEKGRPAEALTKKVCAETRGFLETGAVACEYLADQLLLPLALAGGGSFTASSISEHTRTNINVIRSFLNVAMEVEREGKIWRVTVEPRR